MSTIQVSMSRPDPSHPWGFRMAGGRDFGAPLIIKKVNPKSLSGRHGVEVGDRVLSIGGNSCNYMTHQEAMMAVTRSSNDLELVLLRVPGGTTTMPTAPARPQLPASISPGGSWSSNASQGSGQPSPGIYRSNRGIQLRPSVSSSDYNDGAFYPSTPPPSAVSTHAPSHTPSYAPVPAAAPSYAPVPAAAPSYVPVPTAAPSYAPGPTSAPWRGPQKSLAATGPTSPASPSRPKQPSAMNRLEKTMAQPGKPLPVGFSPTAPKADPKSTRRGQSQRHQAGAQAPAGRDPVCDVCHTLIRGPFIVALDRCFCPEHFRCSQCGIRMEDCGFVEEGGLLYCDTDYARLLAPRCARCGLPVVEKVVNAMRKSWHPGCFVCNHCKKPMATATPGTGEATFRVGDDNLPYCDEDWSKLFQAKCEGCGFPIDDMDQIVEAMGKNFHASCFTCSACRVSLSGRPFFTRNGKAFCKAHARAAALF